MRAGWMGMMVLASCAGHGGTDAHTDTDGDTDVAGLHPSVSIAAPAADATVSGPDVVLTLDVQDFELTGKQSAARYVPPLPLWGLMMLCPTADAHTPGESPNGYIAVRVDGVLTAEITETTTTLTGLSPGEHSVEVELLYPDGDGFYPAVLDDVTFNVGPATFAQVDAILQRSCATYGCHAGPELITGLDLTSANAYDMLVSVESHEAPGVDRVSPGDAVNSYLIAKLNGTQEALGGSGDRMPTPFGLSPEELAIFTSWVDGGALP